ncbi:MAG: radical SAM family heme chaperone HemW [Saprospiraceae bacterium]|nr:radical SAM family heme chaperone HemW [Saprospiraceae bacterium]
MAGIYIHIPFCKQACHYCNFHFSTSLKHKSDLVEAICTELTLRKEEITSVETLYFGGGTPSVLSRDELELILDCIFENYNTSALSEVTLEANPDDLDGVFLRELEASAINRLSIGVQSFFDVDLEWMHRAHSARLAADSIKLAQDIGFEQMTIDLIYGSPTTSDEMWAKNLDTWLDLGIPHLSAYALTVEPKTALEVMIQKGKSRSVEDATAVRQLQYLQNWAATNHISHYEISNLCRASNYAKHNSNYWTGQPYLGIGPSAHSYDGATTRRWNIANNIQYIQQIKEKTLFWEEEYLSPTDLHNEYIMTRLRTTWGVNLSAYATKFGSAWRNQLEAAIEPFTQQQLINVKDGAVVLTPKALPISDSIIAELFIDKD